MIMSIHQPEHLPWLGFFHKMMQVEKFVILDNVQYRRRYFQNRNKIRTHNGSMWLTVPLQNSSRDVSLIKDVHIACDDNKWRKKNLLSISRSYSKATFFNDYYPEFEDLYLQSMPLLADFNITLIRYFMKHLSIKAELVFASDMDVEGEKGELIFNICKNIGATCYYSGISGSEYLDTGLFAQAGIRLEFQEFYHPVYSQEYEPFIPCMSALDLLFNHGPLAADIIQGKGVDVIKETFK